jgi:hypothetical protein
LRLAKLVGFTLRFFGASTVFVFLPRSLLDLAAVRSDRAGICAEHCPPGR